MQCPPPQTECVHVDITVLPTSPPPAEPFGPTIPRKLLAIMAKYKYNWRMEQLAKPRVQSHKYKPKPEGKIAPPKIPPKLSDEMKFYADQMAKPKLMNLYVNRRLYGGLTRGIKKKYNKNIDKAWDSIYNYYKKKERDRRLRELFQDITNLNVPSWVLHFFANTDTNELLNLEAKLFELTTKNPKQLRQKDKTKAKKHVVDQKLYDNLAKPKPVFHPEPAKKPSKLFTNFDRLDELASPKPSHVEPPKSLEVNPHALTYEPTENILKLAKLPARFLNLPPPLEPGKVRRSALRYKVSPRIEQMAQPKKSNEKSKEDEDFDPWAISKNALKYKPTARILELAKPVERD